MPGSDVSEFSAFATDPARLAVERAIGELRMNRPVLLECADRTALVFTIDYFEGKPFPKFSLPADARLVLTGPRLKQLGAAQEVAGSITLKRVDVAQIEYLSLDPAAKLNTIVNPANKLEHAALDLARLAMLTPAVLLLTSKEDKNTPPYLSVSTEQIRSFQDMQLNDLHIVARAFVPLENAPQSEFVIFRGGDGLRDQVAVIVGTPDFKQRVSVRLHSACLTGDLFGSLKCDCGDQLRFSVKKMAEQGSGVLLYLDQEGRGHGLANKIRAYKLQANKGLDTYAADDALGFGMDQRRFDIGAQMLNKLGFHQVRLITNNPAKVEALRKTGLDVEPEQIMGRITPENIHYLEAKRSKSQHSIDIKSQLKPPRQKT